VVRTGVSATDQAKDRLKSVRVPKIVPKSYRQKHGHAHLVELASDRPTRTRNRLNYRFAHWPVWIFAFFIAPGPITFKLFADGFGPEVAAWLLIVAVGTAIAGVRGWLPGTEAKPYVLLYGEDTPNPLHRVICYTVAWGDVISYGVLNLVCLVDAVINGAWRSTQIYAVGYFPIAGAVWLLGILGHLPRAKRSTKGEGMERRQFYGAVWAVAVAQPILLIMWKTLPLGPFTNVVKLVVFAGLLLVAGQLARRGFLPRTRPILAGTIEVN
jgi:hypothetical protein